jgi:serine/threonine protein kinase
MCIGSFKISYAVYELMDTDLGSVIDSKQKLSEQHIKFIIYQILKAVIYMHSANVLHRDIVK